MWKVKKKLGYTLLLVCLLLLLSGTCSAAEQEVVTLSIQEYSSLKTEFQMLKINNEKQAQLLNKLKEQLETSENMQSLSAQDWVLLKEQLNKEAQKAKQLELRCATLEQQLKSALQSSKTAENELSEANKSLEQYAKEVKSDRRKLKLQRNILGASLVYVLAKNIK